MKNKKFLKEKVIAVLVELDDIKRLGLRDKDKGNIKFALNLITSMFDKNDDVILRNLAGAAHLSFNVYAASQAISKLDQCINYLEKLVKELNKE